MVCRAQRACPTENCPILSHRGKGHDADRRSALWRAGRFPFWRSQRGETTPPSSKEEQTNDSTRANCAPAAHAAAPTCKAALSTEAPLALPRAHPPVCQGRGHAGCHAPRERAIAALRPLTAPPHLSRN